MNYSIKTNENSKYAQHDNTYIFRALKKTRGRFFSVDYERKDGTRRTILCRMVSNAEFNHEYVVLKDVRDNGYRHLKLNKIHSINAQGLNINYDK